ncbi:hypothetical protein LX36DRAFT_652416 [Colletotrichum falcatum]|nr:hypothetical protein LX36DRAFT_652416 [Colletotrichum falcatum]
MAISTVAAVYDVALVSTLGSSEAVYWVLRMHPWMHSINAFGRRWIAGVWKKYRGHFGLMPAPDSSFRSIVIQPTDG